MHNINISSIIGTTGNAGQTNYGAAKAGLEGFTRSLAQEIASRNITVNCVAPGFIQTDMTESLPTDYLDNIIGSVPLNRIGIPDDVSNTVMFLASNSANSTINGSYCLC